MTPIPRTFILTVNRPISRFEKTCTHLNEQGIKWERFNGLDNQLCRLNSKDTFDIDRAGERLETKHVAATLTHYLCWKVLSYLPEDSFWVLEYDVRMVSGWREQYEEAMSVLPDDWDLVNLGAACCKGRETYHVGKNLYDVRYPLSGHAWLYRKKCLETLLTVHQKINAPLDISMFYNSLPLLRCYSILPRLCEQHNTPLPE